MSELTTIMRNQLKSELKKGASKEPDFTLYHSLEMEQMLLPETAHFLATKTYFKMLGVSLTCEARSNAEFISPGGVKTKLPILRCERDLVAEFQPIVRYVEENIGLSLYPADYDQLKRDNWNAALIDMDADFTNAEMYMCWIDNEIRDKLTYERYGCPYEWPLNRIQCWRKLRQVRRILELEDWLDYSLEQVSEDVSFKCAELSDKLQDKPYFNGAFPTEFDAMIFGHLYAILTTNLEKPILAEEINKRPNLVRFCQNIETTYFSRKASR